MLALAILANMAGAEAVNVNLWKFGIYSRDFVFHNLLMISLGEH